MNLHDNIMRLIETKLEITTSDYEYQKFTQLITLVNISYLKIAVYTFEHYLKDDTFKVDSKFDFLMKIYNDLIKEHQVLFLLFNLFETSLRSKLAYTLSLKYSSTDRDDWLHREELTPRKIKVVLDKVKRYISEDGISFDDMNSYEIFDYVMFGDLKSLYYDFWSDIGYLFKTKNYKGHKLQEIGKNRLRDMLDAIRKARNDIAHHKPLQKGRKKRYKLIEDIEHILLHLGFNLDEAINNIDPQHKIIRVGFYEKADKVSRLLRNPSKKNLKEINKLSQYRGVDSFFQKELLKSDLLGWFNVLNREQYFSSSSFPIIERDNYLPFWKELDFLEQISRRFGEADYIEIEKEIVSILDNFILYLGELLQQNININTHNHWIVFKIIQRFKLEYLKIEYIDFIRLVLLRDNIIVSQLNNDFIEKIYLSDSNIHGAFFNIFLEYTISDNSYKKIKPLVKEYDIKSFFKQYIELIDDKYFDFIIETLLNKIEELINFDRYIYYSSLRSIEDSSQRQRYQEDFPVLIIDFVRDILEKQNPNKIKVIIKDLLNSKIDVFNRLAIHIINFFFSELKELFFQYSNGNILDNHALFHEIYVLFENQVDNFTEDEVDFVLELIEKQEFSDKTNIEERKIYQKRKYLYALKDSKKYSKCLERFNIYNSQLDIEDKHPAFNSYFSGFKWIVPISPLSKDEMKNKKVDELLEYLSNFKSSNNDRLDEEPTKEGLVKVFAQFISDNPKKYISNLEQFSILDEEYFYEILNCYSDFLEKNRDINLIKIVEFINLSLMNFIEKDSIETWYIINSIYKFIKKISSDKNGFILSKEIHILFLKIFEQLEIILEESEEDETQITDYIFYLLNSNWGNFYQGLIEYSLKYSRDNNLEENRWLNEIKNIFIKSIEQQKSINIFTIIGRYIINIKYLDNNWLEENFEQILSDSEFIKIEAFIVGYLDNSSIDFEIHNKLYKLGIFERVLNNKNNKQYIERLIEYILFYYISKDDSFDNEKSMIAQLLSISNRENIESILNILFFNKNNSKNISKKQLQILWRKLFKKIENNNYANLYINLLKLIKVTSDLDSEDMSLINLSIERVPIEVETINFHNFWIAEKFLKLIDKNPKYIANIYIKLLSKSLFGEYNEEEVSQILEYLYQHNLKQEANKISNLYGEYGIDKWKDIYDKYN